MQSSVEARETATAPVAAPQAKPAQTWPRAGARRVAFAGAGNIAAAHGQAISLLSGLDLVGVIDPQEARAQDLARKYGAEIAATSLKSLLDQGPIDALHVLTPPNLHEDLVLEALALGIPTLVEKPMASEREGSDAMLAAASLPGAAPHYINHNFVFHPAFRRLREALDSGAYGRIVSLSCTYAMPLRQLGAGQFHHWMFRRPANLLLEQAVHPFSQVLTLTGPARRFQVLAGAAHKAPIASPIPKSLSIQFQGDRCEAQVYLHFGATYPTWQITALCTDGVLSADMIRDRFEAHEQTQSLEPLDNLKDALRLARGARRDGVRGLADYGLSMLGLKGRSDPFFLSMKDSLRAFYDSAPASWPQVNTPAGANGIVHLCENIAAEAFAAPSAVKAAAKSKADFQPQAVVTGGTGFIGKEIVKALVAKGVRVGVVARNAAQAADLFDSDLVRTYGADVRSADDLTPIMQGAEFAINAAGPLITENWEDCDRNVREAADGFAQACLRANIRKVVHLSSIAALNLGEAGARIEGATPTDARPELRPNYSRAKKLGEELFLGLWKDKGLPVTILRPGVVVGEGGIALHTGVGLFVNDRHCVGWGRGENPLPFVLAEDVASACVAALFNDAEGKVFNLVGDVRLTARDYVDELGAALGRPLVYHGPSTEALYREEVGKWLIKRVGGRKVPAPSLHDLKSRAMYASFDCTDIKRDLGWAPVADRKTFIDKAIRIFGAD